MTLKTLIAPLSAVAGRTGSAFSLYRKPAALSPRGLAPRTAAAKEARQGQRRALPLQALAAIAALLAVAPSARATIIVSTITGTRPAGSAGIQGAAINNVYGSDAFEFTAPVSFVFEDALLDMYTDNLGSDGNFAVFLYTESTSAGRDIPGSEIAEVGSGTAPTAGVFPAQPSTLILQTLRPAANLPAITLSANTKYWLVVAAGDAGSQFDVAIGGTPSSVLTATQEPSNTSPWFDIGATSNLQFEIDGTTPGAAPEPGGMLLLITGGAIAALMLKPRRPRLLMTRALSTPSVNSTHSARIARAIAVLALSLILCAGANAAATLNMSVGTLKVGSTYDFLLDIGLNGNGQETPYTVFTTIGSNGAPLSGVMGSQTTSYPESANPSFTCDFSFSVAALSTLSLSQNYPAFVGSTTSSVTLMQGSNVVATGIQTNAKTPLGVAYSLPSVILQPGTQYDLLITTLGVPSSADKGPSVSQGWAQVGVDVSAPTPPGPVTVFSPAQAAGGVATTPTLTWTAATLAASYDLYLGTSPLPPLVATVSGTSYSPAALVPNTTYYWYLVSKNPAGSATSATWSFTTGASQTSPAIKSGGVVSASAFGQLPTVAPGSWIEIYGSNLASDSRSWGAIDFSGVLAPTTLDGTKVTIGGQAAFIDYISPLQINAQVPSNVAAGPQAIIVTTANGPSAPYTVTVNATAPGLLAPASFNIGGAQYAAAVFSDGATYVLPPGAIAGVASRRAQPGDAITLYGVGFGPVVPNTPAGQIVEQSNTLAQSLQVSFGSSMASVTYGGLAPGAVGLYQFNVVVPSVPSSDAVPLTFTLGGIAGTQKLFLAVQNGGTAQ